MRRGGRWDRPSLTGFYPCPAAGPNRGSKIALQVAGRIGLTSEKSSLRRLRVPPIGQKTGAIVLDSLWVPRGETASRSAPTRCPDAASGHRTRTRKPPESPSFGGFLSGRFSTRKRRRSTCVWGDQRAGLGPARVTPGARRRGLSIGAVDRCGPGLGGRRARAPMGPHRAGLDNLAKSDPHRAARRGPAPRLRGYAPGGLVGHGAGGVRSPPGPACGAPSRPDPSCRRSSSRSHRA